MRTSASPIRQRCDDKASQPVGWVERMRDPPERPIVWWVSLTLDPPYGSVSRSHAQHARLDLRFTTPRQFAPIELRIERMPQRLAELGALLQHRNLLRRTGQRSRRQRHFRAAIEI